MLVKMLPLIKRQGVLVLPILVAGPAISLAAPMVQSVTGQCIKGGEVVLTGTDFGNGAQTLMWDAVDNRSEYSRLTSGAIVPEDLWQNGYFASDTPVTLSADRLRSGSSLHYRAVNKSKLYWPKPLQGRVLDSIYVSWWYRPSTHPNGNGGSNKFIRIWGDSNGEGARISWTSMHLTYGVKGESGVNWGSFNGTVNDWNLMEIWVDKDSGSIRTAINGIAVHDVNDFTDANASDGLSVYLIGWDPSEQSRYPGMINDFDNIYVSDTRARIEITGNATWRPTDVREIQPISSWSNNRIAFRATGSAASLSDAFVHVLGSNGSVIASAPLSCSGAVPKDPTPPSGLSVR